MKAHLILSTTQTHTHSSWQEMRQPWCDFEKRSSAHDRCRHGLIWQKERGKRDSECACMFCLQNEACSTVNTAVKKPLFLLLDPQRRSLGRWSLSRHLDVQKHTLSGFFEPYRKLIFKTYIRLTLFRTKSFRKDCYLNGFPISLPVGNHDFFDIK